MFTIRLEKHEREENGAVKCTRVAFYEVPYFDLRKWPTSHEIGIPNALDVRIYHDIADAHDAWDACYIMNSHGATIDKIIEGAPG